MPKRKRSNGFAKAAKRFKKRKVAKKQTARRTKMAGRGPWAIERPPKFVHIAPRVTTTHVNKISLQISTPAVGFFTQADPVHIIPARLRDPDPVFPREQPFPENFTTLASLYRRYRVNGVKLFASIHGLTNTEDEKFFFCVYTTSDNDGATDPWNSTVVGSRGARDAFLQHPGIRKKMISDSGTTGQRRNNTFNIGYYSISGIEAKRRIDMEDDLYSGTVNADGTAVQDPLELPRIWFRIVNPRYAGSAAARTYTLSLTCKFYVEWFDRREALEPFQGEVDP